MARADQRAARALVRALESIDRTPPPQNLDAKAIAGRSPWLRLRVGDWRLLYRPLRADELRKLALIRGAPVEPGTVFVERIVNRRDLERVIAALP